MSVFRMENIDDIFDRLDVAAKNFPVKALAAEMHDKAESTLRNELIRQPGYKLGLVTALEIMRMSGDLSALEIIESMFDRVGIPIDNSEKRKMGKANWLGHIGKVARESGDIISSLAESVKDGCLNDSERRLCRKECHDALCALASLWWELK